MAGSGGRTKKKERKRWVGAAPAESASDTNKAGAEGRWRGGGGAPTVGCRGRQGRGRGRESADTAPGVGQGGWAAVPTGVTLPPQAGLAPVPRRAAKRARPLAAPEAPFRARAATDLPRAGEGKSGIPKKNKTAPPVASTPRRSPPLPSPALLPSSAFALSLVVVSCRGARFFLPPREESAAGGGRRAFRQPCSPVDGNNGGGGPDGRRPLGRRAAAGGAGGGPALPRAGDGGLHLSAGAGSCHALPCWPGCSLAGGGRLAGRRPRPVGAHSCRWGRWRDGGGTDPNPQARDGIVPHPPPPSISERRVVVARERLAGNSRGPESVRRVWGVVGQPRHRTAKSRVTRHRHAPLCPVFSASGGDAGG